MLEKLQSKADEKNLTEDQQLFYRSAIFAFEVIFMIECYYTSIVKPVIFSIFLVPFIIMIKCTW